MRCLCAISLFLPGFFQLLQPSVQYVRGALYTPHPVQLGEFLNITCSGKQVFGSVSHGEGQITHEVAILKLKEDLRNGEYHTVDPSFTFILHPLKKTGRPFYTIGDRTDKIFTFMATEKVMQYVALKMYVKMKCEDYGLWQCHMRLRNPKPPPETVYYHNDFYVDYVDNFPKLKIIPKNAKYVEGKKLNITCEQTTREKKVTLALVYKPNKHTIYSTLQGIKTVRETYRVPSAPCGGYFLRHLSISVYMNDELWNSEIRCIAKRPKVHVEELGQVNDHDVVSRPLIPASCTFMGSGCISSIAAIRAPLPSTVYCQGFQCVSNRIHFTVAKVNPISYSTLLPMLVLIIMSFGILVCATLAMKDGHD